jgi:Xaa-Pro aminopeptidase
MMAVIYTISRGKLLSKREIPKFNHREFEQRVTRARRMMTGERLDGLVVTSEANMEYLSGFTTQFAWNTPTRPWYFLLPRSGKAVGVIPEIGITNWKATSWVDNILTWPSPRPENEGLDLLADAIGRIKRKYGRIGFELGAESRLGMPAGDLLRLKRKIRPFDMVDGFGIIRELRMIKSPAEVSRIRRICRIVADAFDALPGYIQSGDTEKDVVRKFQADILLRGADKTPFTSIGSGKGGYESIIMGPTHRKLKKGDLFLIDTGARYDGYFCDFDRNFAIGSPPKEARRTHDILYRATDAGIKAARPGNTAADVFQAQAKVLINSGIRLGNVGRLGHGLGKVMTEPPSVKPEDHTRLVPGMVLTIEPSAMYEPNKILVHEENLVITENGARLLSRRAPQEIPVINL